MEYMNVKPSNFNDICRICMENSYKFLSISELRIIEMMISCTSVQIEINDGLPKQICDACYNQLEKAYNFRELCEKSDKTFRQITEQCQVIKIEIEENESIILENSESEDNEIVIKPEIEQEELEIQCNKPSNTLDDDHNLLKNPETVQKSLSNYYEYNIFNTHFMDANEKLETVNTEIKIDNDQYVCEICHSKFDKVWYLGYHMRRAHGVAGVRCNYCALVCYHQLHLITHLKSHVASTLKQKHECHVCKKLFNTVSQLTKHQRKHKLYPCNICNKEFEYKSSLKLHTKVTHLSNNTEAKMPLTLAEKKWFKCCDCSRKFSNRICLKKHMKNNHKSWNRRDTKRV